MNNAIQALAGEPLVQEIAEQYKLSAERFLTSSLKILASRLSRELAESEVLAMCSLMKRYHLDPFAGHLYLQETFEGPSSTIRPVLKIDGWLTMLNSQEQFDGLEFKYSDEMISNPLDPIDESVCGRQVPMWMEASIYRNDRSRPTVVREYFLEVYQHTESWRAMGSRQLRHKTIIQCSRVAFGLGGLFDEDDISRMLGERSSSEGDGTTVQSAPAPEDRPTATDFVPAEAAVGEACASPDSSSTEEDASSVDDDLLAASFGGHAVDEASCVSVTDGEESSSVAQDADDAASDHESIVSDEASSNDVQPNCDVEEGDASHEQEVAESDGLPVTLDQLAESLSEQDLAVAQKIVSEFDLRIRGAGGMAMQEKAVSLSLKWVADRADSGMLSEHVAQYITASVHEMFPDVAAKAA